MLQQKPPIWSCLSFTLEKMTCITILLNFMFLIERWGFFFHFSFFIFWLGFFSLGNAFEEVDLAGKTERNMGSLTLILSLWRLQCFRGTLFKPWLPHCLLLAVYYGSCKCQAQSLKSWRRHQWAAVWEHIGWLDVGARLLPSCMLLCFFLTFRFF